MMILEEGKSHANVLLWIPAYAGMTVEIIETI